MQESRSCRMFILLCEEAVKVPTIFLALVVLQMENPTYRERVLLGYDARGTLGGPYSYSSRKCPFRHSEVDFSDVFGGPPRCSTEEAGHSYRETVILSRKEEEQLPSAHSDPWAAGLGQRSVFGEQSPSRRLLAKDFYDDIFKVDDPLGSKRRYSDISHCSSSIPVSRVLSPVHPSIPNTHEPSLAKPALLRQLRLRPLYLQLESNMAVICAIIVKLVCFLYLFMYMVITLTFMWFLSPKVRG